MKRSGTDRVRNRRGEGAQLRDDLLEAAREILVEAGNEAGLSVRGITKRAGVVPQSFYLRFSDLDELLLELYRDGHSQLLDAVTASVAAAGGSSSERLAAFAGGYLGFATRRAGIYRLAMGTTGTLHPDWAADDLPGVPLLRLLGQLLAPFGPDAADSAVTTALAAAQLHGLASLILDRPTFPWPPQSALVVGFVRLYDRSVP